MNKFVDKSKCWIIAFGIFVIHIILSLISIICIFSGNANVLHLGIDMAGVLILAYPIIGGLIYVIVSLIGIIKHKKILPYLIYPLISLVVWLVLGRVAAFFI